jgi:hypothetical protein
MSRSYQGKAGQQPAGGGMRRIWSLRQAQRRSPCRAPADRRLKVAHLWPCALMAALSTAWKALRGHRGPLLALGVAAGVLARLLAP